MRTFTALLLITGIILTGSWCWVYQSYVAVQDRVAETYESGDYAGAMEELRAYRSRKISYPILNAPFLEKFRLRLRYHEGVISGLLGDIKVSEQAFQDASRSPEADIAASSLYNIALHALERDDLDSARSQLSRALRLNPEDTETKVNLELVIKGIREQGTDAVRLKEEKQEGEVQPGEQWRFDIPGEEGESGSESRRSYL